MKNKKIVSVFIIICNLFLLLACYTAAPSEEEVVPTEVPTAVPTPVIPTFDMGNLGKNSKISIVAEGDAVFSVVSTMTGCTDPVNRIHCLSENTTVVLDNNFIPQVIIPGKYELESFHLFGNDSFIYPGWIVVNGPGNEIRPLIAGDVPNVSIFVENIEGEDYTVVQLDKGSDLKIQVLRPDGTWDSTQFLYRTVME